MGIRRTLFIPILFAAAGCEWKTTSRVGVQVTTPLLRARDDGARDAVVGGAKVRVRCPGGAGEDLGSTGAEGWVLVTTRAVVPLTCDLAISSSPGFLIQDRSLRGSPPHGFPFPPSRTTICRSAATFLRRSFFPLGHRTSRVSTFAEFPSPK